MVKNNEFTITTLSDREHVLAKPTMHISSPVSESSLRWVMSKATGTIVQKPVCVSDGFLKIVDEVISNASDHYFRLKQLALTAPPTMKIHHVNYIEVSIADDGTICVKNGGNGIPTTPDKDGIYPAERAYTVFKSSSSFTSDGAGSMVGTHGYGVKLTMTFSTKARVESVDPNRGEMFSQSYGDNLDPKVTSKAIVTSYKKVPYTLVEFLPDWKRLGLTGMNQDLMELIHFRVVSMITHLPSDIRLSFNGTNITQRGLDKFALMFEGASSTGLWTHSAVAPNNPSQFWKVVAMPALNGNPINISIVNGGITKDHGKHFKAASEKIAAQFLELAKTKRGNVKEITAKALKGAMSLFVFMNINNPTYPSQSKNSWEGVVAMMPDFKTIDQTSLEKMFKWEPVIEAANLTKVTKQLKAENATKGKLTNYVDIKDNIFFDANKAGQKAHSKKCLLILCEGNSALANARAVIGEIPNGRDYFGALALKGKPLNVTNATMTQIAANEEMVAIHKALGLNPAKKDCTVDDLRYGGVRLLMDFDLDGIGHITPLVINFFLELYPNLVHEPGFIQYIVTPLIKVHHRGGTSTVFYTKEEFDKWMAAGHRRTTDDVKYYKGIATSSKKEMIEYFTTQKRFLDFRCEGPADVTSMKLLFDKKLADERKLWLNTYRDNEVVDYGTLLAINYTDFVNRGTKHYAMYTLKRAIPHVMDGLKDSQRKIVFAIMKKTGKDIAPDSMVGVRVAQLAGYVSETADYHHGEASLQDAIIKMAQNYVGSNNINLLNPLGQFGTRFENGANAGQPRYINTTRTTVLETLFDSRDDAVLTAQESEGKSVEPSWYAPIIPMLLVNGALGIATGYSTNIPQYDPKILINYIEAFLTDVPQRPALYPYTRGHKGLLIKLDDQHFASQGTWTWDAQRGVVTVTEIPIGMSINSYISYIKENSAALRAIETPIGDTTSDGGVAAPKRRAAPKANATKAKRVVGLAKQAVTIIDNPSSIRDESNGDDISIKLTLTPEAATLMNNSAPHNGSLNREVATLLGLWCEPGELRLTNMHALSATAGGIRSYATAEDILEEYIGVRLDLYAKRKAHLLHILEQKMLFEKAIVRYIKDVNDGVIVVKSLSTKDLVAHLKAGKWPAKDGSSYAYITELPITSLTEDRMNERLARVADLATEIAKLKRRSPSKLWQDDLVRLKTLLA